MTGSSRSAGVGPLLAVGAATSIMAALTLRNARRTMELAEYHAEHLRSEQSRLMALLREERLTLQEQMEREREQHLLEVRLQEERSSQELSLSLREQEKLAEEARQEREQHLVEVRRLYELSKRELSASRRDQERLAQMVRREREQHREAQQRARQESAKYREAQQRAQREREGRERERSARLETEGRIEQLEREIRRLQEAQRESAAREKAARENATRESVALIPAGSPEAHTEARVDPREPSKVRPSPAREARGGGSPKPPASLAETSKPARIPSRDKKLGRGVWHPHPDDDTGKGEGMPEKRDRETVGAPVEMYRKHYDKYLENYLGYVELAEELYRTRDDGKAPDAPFGDREWEERLRRILDGIKRTTARLDILEQHNPELVTDARISRRASVARRHAQLP